jgi:hypothetical protein
MKKLRDCPIVSVAEQDRRAQVLLGFARFRSPVNRELLRSGLVQFADLLH